MRGERPGEWITVASESTSGEEGARSIVSSPPPFVITAMVASSRCAEDESEADVWTDPHTRHRLAPTGISE